MPYVFEETQVGERRPASEFPSLPSEVYKATYAQAYEENPIAAILRAKDLADDYRSGGKRLDYATARQRLHDNGMDFDIKVSEAGITDAALNTLIYRKGVEKRRQEIFGQSEGGFAQGAGRLGISLATGLIDPLNVASAFIPVFGEARYTSMLAKAGSGLGRTGVRAGVGAVEGVAGAALVEPIIAGSRRFEQADYGMADSLLNLAFGGVFGSGLHSVGGAISDGVNLYRGTDPAWRGMERVPVDEIPLVQNLRQEIERGMDTRDVTRVTETWSTEAKRAVEADIRTVTPAEAAHQALPPQARENALRQAIIQAASDEPVDVSRLINLAETPSAGPAEGNPIAFSKLPEGLTSEVGQGKYGDSYVRVFAPDGRKVAELGYFTGTEPSGRRINPDVYVDPEFRRQGIASAMYELAEKNGGKLPALDQAGQVRSEDAIAFRTSLDSKREKAGLPRVGESKTNQPSTTASPAAMATDERDLIRMADHAEKVLARETDTGTPTADALKMATEEASLAQSDLKAVADRLGMEAEDAELRDVLEAAANSERWAKAAELATICLTRGG